MSKSNRHRKLARILLLCVIGFSSTACYFDGHWGRCGGFRVYAPVSHCR